MRVDVYIHEPLDPNGWELVEPGVTPDEAASMMRAWGAKGWRVLAVSPEYDPNSGEWKK